MNIDKLDRKERLVIYINSFVGYEEFLMLVDDELYVDKSNILELLNKKVCKTTRWVCVTRPRRFGKSSMTYLIESYYSKVVDTKNIFDKLKISVSKDYLKHLNQYNIVKIDFSKFYETGITYNTYINRIINLLDTELKKMYANVDFDPYAEIADKFEAVNDKFIFIFDEWDFIFNQNIYIENHIQFLNFLRYLLKDRSYVALCYMTGILPIKKHSSSSALNMFREYTFLNDDVLAQYFGFTEEEVKHLCHINNGITYEKVAEWYNGYTTKKGIRLFNPRSVIFAISDNSCQSYWTSTGAMDEVANYLKLNAFGLREDLIRMLNGEEINIDIIEDFRAGAKLPSGKKEIYSAMITHGFLSYAHGRLRIPNKELMIEFENSIKHDCFGELAQMIKNADEMLLATFNKDAKKMAKIIHDIHNLEIPILKYNDENSLSCVLTLAYLSARNRYRIEREEKSSKGYVDFIFHPRNIIDLPIVIELKKDKSTKIALEQIIEREYVTKLKKEYNRNILIVGIKYNSIDKIYTCEIIELRDF
ncbi:AAA family ATPase [Candidatus Epulonipiscioides gigas]|nr:AAA family ATPase [Epulopiscium sp. SCG-C07WGA-EpuloA2]